MIALAYCTCETLNIIYNLIDIYETRPESLYTKFLYLKNKIFFQKKLQDIRDEGSIFINELSR